MITIYSSPTCVKCKALMQFCNNNNIHFKEKDVTKDFKAKARLVTEGIMSLPVVEIDGNLYTENLKDVVSSD